MQSFLKFFSPPAKNGRFQGLEPAESVEKSQNPVPIGGHNADDGNPGRKILRQIAQTICRRILSKGRRIPEGRQERQAKPCALPYPASGSALVWRRMADTA